MLPVYRGCEGDSASSVYLQVHVAIVSDPLFCPCCVMRTLCVHVQCRLCLCVLSCHTSLCQYCFPVTSLLTTVLIVGFMCVCGDRSVFTSTDYSWGLGVCCDGAFFHSMKPSSVQMALFMPGAKMYKCFILIIQVFK